MGIERRTLQRLLIWTLVAAVVFLFIWRSWRAPLFGFGAILFAVFLNAIAEWVLRHTRWTRGYSYALVVIGLVVIVGLAI